MASIQIPEAEIERELERAKNKTDFFRAFKMHADYYNLVSFLVLRIRNPAEGDRLIDLVGLAKLPSEMQAEFGEIVFDYKDRFLSEVAVLKRPKIWTGDACGDYARLFGGDRILGVPHLTNNGTRYCVLLGDCLPKRSGDQLTDIIYDFSNIIRRYCDNHGIDEAAPKFSKREREVVEWTSEGKTTAEIAIILGLSEYTVNEYISSAMRKIEAVSRGHLVAKAIRAGIIE